MNVFIYKGLQTDGRVIEGELRAEVPQDAYRKMELLGLLPILVHEVRPDGQQFDLNESGDRVTDEFASVSA